MLALITKLRKKTILTSLLQGVWVTIVMLFTLSVSAQSTYTWNGTILNTNWSTPTNWTPTRTTPATNDILRFTYSASVTGVLADTIGRISLSNNALLVWTPDASADGKTLVFNTTGVNSIDLGNNSSLSFLGTSDLDLSLAGHLNMGNNSKFIFNTLATQTVSVKGNLSAASATIDMSSGGLDHILNLAGASNTLGTLTTTTLGNSTVNYNGNVNQNIFASANYINLTTSSGGTKTLQGITQVKGDLNIGAGSILDASSQNFTVLGASSVSGTFKDTQNGGTNTFTGLITVNSSGTFNPTSNSGFVFNGGITNNGTFASTGSSVFTFSTNDQILGGNKPIAVSGNVIVSGAITISNQNTDAATGFVVTGTLNGNNSNSVFENKTVFTYRNANSPMITGSLLATTCPNTVRYDNGTQNIKATTYCNLYLSGTKTLTGTTIVNNELTIYTLTTLQVGAFDLTVKNRTWMPLVSKLLDNSTAGLTTLSNVELGRGSSIEGGSSGNIGVVNITGILAVTGEANSLGAVSVNVTGETTIRDAGLKITSALGDKTFNNITLSNPTAGTVGWNNAVNEPITITGNLTVSAGMPFTSGTGNYAFTGDNKVINTNTPLTITTASFSGTYTGTNGTAVGADIFITNPTVSSGGKFINSTTSYPLTLAGSATTRAFNNDTRVFFNKFDKIAVSDHTGNLISTNNTTDFTFTRAGSGDVYALRSRDLNPVPTTAIVRFTLQGTTTTTAANNAGSLLLGSNMEDNASAVNTAAGLVFNLKNGNALSISSQDGSYTSSDYSSPDKEFWWVVNRSGASQLYTGPDGNSYTIASSKADLWYNGAIITTGITIPASSNTLSEVKFVMSAGNGTIKLNNLRINPISQFSIPSECWYAGQSINIPVTITTAGPGGGFNAGTVFKVQRSNSSGVFNTDLTKDIYGTLTPADPNSSTVFTITTTFPDKYSDVGTKDMGSDYRYRVISTDLLVISKQNNFPMYYIVNPGPESIEPNFPTLASVTAFESGKYTTEYWGYRYSSGDSKIIKITGATNTTYIPKLSDFAGSGEYYLVAVSTSGCVSNEKKIVVNCSGTGNLITNGDFSNLGKVGVGKGLNDINGNGIIEFSQGDFETEYNQQDPASGSQLPQGSYTIGTNPQKYNGAFCDMSKGNRAPTKDSNGNVIDGGNMIITDAASNGSKILWRQTISNLEPYTNYVFTFWGVSIDKAHQNTLQFAVYVDCYRMGDDIADNYASSCNWSKYSVQLNTGNQTQLTLSVGNVSAAGSGNDMAIDNLEFYKCSGTGGTNFPVVNKFVWKGYTSDWFNSDNWGVCAPNLPTCGDDVIIPSSLPAGRVYPVISKTYASRTPSAFNTYGGTNINDSFNGTLTNTAGQVKSLTIETGATLTINNSYSLRVCGNLINNGSIMTNSTGTITFFGNALQTVSGTGVFNNVSIDQGNSATTAVVKQAGTVTVSGLLDIKKSSDELDINGYTLYLNGTLATSPGTITGSSTSSMEIGGSGDVGGTLRFTTGAQQLSRLTLNRSVSGQVTLGTPLLLVGGVNALTLTNGLINTDETNLLTLNQSSSVTSGSAHVSGGSNASHINGPMAKITAGTSAFTFPVGNNGFLGEIGIQPSSATTNTFQAQYFRQNPYSLGSLVNPSMAYVSLLEYWRMDRLSGTSKGKISLHWTSYSGVSAIPSQWSDLRVSRYSDRTDSTLQGTSPTTGIWQSRGNTATSGTQASGYVTSAEISSFSPYTFGTATNYNPLPVQLLNFTATLDNSQVRLNWSTASEKNSSYFNVMRSSDGIHFTVIGKVASAGESSSLLTYTFTDPNPLLMNYYRLEQVDKDGQSTLSKIITIQVKTAEIKIDIFPNPSDGKQLYLYTNYEGSFDIRITSLLGVEVGRETLISKGNILNITPVTSLAPGLYVISVQMNGKVTQHKIIIK